MTSQVSGRFDSIGIEGGEAISIGWSEPADSTFRWRMYLDVFVEDWFRAGPIVTVPPRGPLAPEAPIYNEASSARIIARAYFPGARAWRLQGRAEQTLIDPGAPAAREARGELSLTAGPCGGITIGLHPVNAWEIGPEGLQVPPTTRQSGVLPISPATALLVPSDPTRQRLVLTSSSPFYIGGSSSVDATTGLLVPANTPFVTRSRRAIYATSTGAANVTIWSENA